MLLTHGPATAGELAEWAGLTAGGAITGVIDRRKGAGFTHRSPDHVYRRRVVVIRSRGTVLSTHTVLLLVVISDGDW